jgi:hypothetical protein
MALALSMKRMLLTPDPLSVALRSRDTLRELQYRAPPLILVIDPEGATVSRTIESCFNTLGMPAESLNCA